MTALIGTVIFGLLIFGTLVAAMSRYKRCPSDQIMVIYGKVGGGRTAKCIHGGAAFVWPLIQEARFLSLTPMTIDIGLQNALSNQNIRIDVPSRFTIGISTVPEVMSVAAVRLLSMNSTEIQENAKDIIFGQLRATIATMSIEEINAKREKFEEEVMKNVESELKKIGLKLINVNITDITDESGYISALGKKAAAEAINKAKVEVAQQERDGEIGQARANQEKRIQVANADAEAVKGENEALVVKANSNAERREKEAEAERRATSAEMIKTAEAKKAAYIAEKQAEEARAEREMSSQKADVVVPAEIAKQKLIIEAEAEKQRQALQGEGEGAQIKERLSGEAEGIQEILRKKGEGFKSIVDAAGGDPEKAAMMLIVEQLPEIVKAQAEMISKIKFDKVVVWDGGGNGASGEGSAAANWLSSFAKMLPGMHEVCEMAGISLPAFLGAANEKAKELKAEKEAGQSSKPAANEGSNE